MSFSSVASLQLCKAHLTLIPFFPCVKMTRESERSETVGSFLNFSFFRSRTQDHPRWRRLGIGAPVSSETVSWVTNCFPLLRKVLSALGPFALVVLSRLVFEHVSALCFPFVSSRGDVCKNTGNSRYAILATWRHVLLWFFGEVSSRCGQWSDFSGKVTSSYFLFIAEYLAK